MSSRELHCPFLNRSDARCGAHFSLLTLDDAFEQCFGCYASCPTYHELLGERRERLADLGHQPGAMSYPPQVIQVRLPVGHHGQAA